MSKRRIKYRNFEPHETQRSYTVFFFYARDPADYFESLLIEHDIPYERGASNNVVKRHLIGVHRKYQERAEELNDKTGEFFRKPFLGSNTFKNVLLIFMLLVFILAILGYLFSGNA